MHVEFGLGIGKETDHLEDLDLDGRVLSKWTLEEWEGTAWIGLV